MRLIKERTLVEDNWIHISDDHDIPTQGQVIIGYDRWLTEGKAALKRGLLVGVRMCGDHDLMALQDDLADITLIALDFPTFADGRCYSYARLLRERLKFDKEIRATGDILFDQLSYMERCGINAFELDDSVDQAIALAAFTEFSESYQAIAPSASVAEKRHSLV